MSNIVLKCENLNKSFGKKKILTDVSFEISEGDILGFIGPNGAGKSTTIRVLMSLINPTSGMILIDGKKLDKNDLELPAKVVGDAKNLVEEKTIKYTEIDLNGHLNNTSYIEYILNTHDEAFYRSHRIKRININYDKEIRSGDKVSLYTNNSLPEIIKGKVGDVNHFTAELEYEER